MGWFNGCCGMCVCDVWGREGRRVYGECKTRKKDKEKDKKKKSASESVILYWVGFSSGNSVHSEEGG